MLVKKKSPTPSKVPIRKQAQGTRIKIVSPKKILQGFPIKLA